MKRRKRVLQSFGIILVGVLLLCGCSDAGNDKKVEREVEMMSENQPPSYSVEDVDLDSLELSAGVWRDNSLDLYSATSSYELKRSYPKDDISGGASILFADSKGVYKGSPDNVENASLLYEWIKHGMQVTDVWELQYPENGRISLICEENGKMYYVNLEPTKEEVPIQKITFAIPSHKLADYQKAVVTFNKKYPAYTIELKADYDETALLKELMTGKGPVLIDTALTGFANQKGLWLPLDKILEKLELSDKLFLPAMEQGCIDGKLYGMVDDFLIEKVITVGGEERNWTYEELTTEILENQKL